MVLGFAAANTQTKLLSYNSLNGSLFIYHILNTSGIFLIVPSLIYIIKEGLQRSVILIQIKSTKSTDRVLYQFINCILKSSKYPFFWGKI